MHFFRVKPAIRNVDQNNYKERIEIFKKEYQQIDRRTGKQKGILAFHRMFSIVGLALYKTLHDKFKNQEELIEKIHDILWKERMAKNIRFIAFFIRRSKTPFKRYLQILGPNNEWFFHSLPPFLIHLR